MRQQGTSLALAAAMKRPAHVDLGAHDDVGLVGGLALLLAAVLPVALHGEPAQQNGLAARRNTQSAWIAGLVISKISRVSSARQGRAWQPSLQRRASDLEPMVAVPVGCCGSSAWNRSASMDTQLQHRAAVRARVSTTFLGTSRTASTTWWAKSRQNALTSLAPDVHDIRTYSGFAWMRGTLPRRCSLRSVPRG